MLNSLFLYFSISPTPDELFVALSPKASHSYYKPMHVLECRMAGIQRAIGDYYETLIDRLYS